MEMLFYMVLYFGFGAVTNEIGISPMVEKYISEEHNNDPKKTKDYFRWMCSILWIVFWPLFALWGTISNLLDRE